MSTAPVVQFISPFDPLWIPVIKVSHAQLSIRLSSHQDVIDDYQNSVARTGATYVEGANGHGHEWKVFREVKLPEGMVLIAGVIDTKTNIIEHPELVADRIINYASVVGRENIIAGTDCGFGTSADRTRVAPSIAWAKLGSLVEGAKLATEQLWR